MRQKHHRRLRVLFYPFVRACETLANALPRRVALSVFAALAELGGVLDRRAARQTLKHLEIAWGDRLSMAERRKLRRRMFRDFGRNLVDFLRLPRMSKHELRHLVKFDGLKHLDEALAKGKGVLAVSAHFGNWELLGAALSARGYEVHVLAREVFDERVEQRLQRLRERAGLKVHVGRGGLLGILRALRRGKIVGVLLDQDTGGPAAFAEFFGQPARTPTTPFLIARKWGAEIVPMLIRLEDDRTHRAVVHPALPCPRKAVDHSPLPSEREAEAEGFVLQDLRAWHRILEREIAARPAQWVWFHRRWKSRPRSAVPGHSFAGSPSNEMLITR